MTKEDLTPIAQVGGIYLYSDVELRIAEFKKKVADYLEKYEICPEPNCGYVGKRVAPTLGELNELVAELEYIKKRIYGVRDD